MADDTQALNTREQLREQVARVKRALLREDSQRAETLFRAASGLCIAAQAALRDDIDVMTEAPRTLLRKAHKLTPDALAAAPAPPRDVEALAQETLTAVINAREWERLDIMRAALARVPSAAVPEIPADCAPQALSSRVCERGTRGCIFRHDGSAPPTEHARVSKQLTPASESTVHSDRPTRAQVEALTRYQDVTSIPPVGDPYGRMIEDSDGIWLNLGDVLRLFPDTPDAKEEKP